MTDDAFVGQWFSECCKAEPLEYFEWLMPDLASARCAKCKEGDVLFRPMSYQPTYRHQLKQEVNPNHTKEVTEKEFDDMVMMDRHARALAQILVEVEDTCPPYGLRNDRPRPMPPALGVAYLSFISELATHFKLDLKQYLRFIQGYTRNWQPRGDWVFYDDEQGHDVMKLLYNPDDSKSS